MLIKHLGNCSQYVNRQIFLTINTVFQHFTKFITTSCHAPSSNLELQPSVQIRQTVVVPCSAFSAFSGTKNICQMTKQLYSHVLQFHWLYSNSTRHLCEVVTSLQTFPFPVSHTESDWHCETKRGCLARIARHTLDTENGLAD